MCERSPPAIFHLAGTFRWPARRGRPRNSTAEAMSAVRTHRDGQLEAPWGPGRGRTTPRHPTRVHSSDGRVLGAGEVLDGEGRSPTQPRRGRADQGRSRGRHRSRAEDAANVMKATIRTLMRRGNESTTRRGTSRCGLDTTPTSRAAHRGLLLMWTRDETVRRCTSSLRTCGEVVAARGTERVQVSRPRKEVASSFDRPKLEQFSTTS